MANVIKPRRIPLVQHLTTDGLYNGSNSMAVNGSSTPVEFYIQPPAGWVFYLHRLLFHIEDERAGFTPDVYAALGAALTNGCLLQYQDDNQVYCHYTTDVEPIKQNSHYTMLMYDTALSSISGGSPTNAVFGGRFTFTKFGSPVILDGDAADNQRLSFTVRDDLSTIVAHEIVVEGYAWKGGKETLGGGRILPDATQVELWY